MVRNVFVCLIICMVFICCGTEKRIVSEVELENLNTIVKSDTIKIQANWANPQNASLIANTNLLPIGSNAGSINLIGTSNYFRIIGDSLSIELPYYGERQLSGSYNPNDVGISFNGKAKEFKHSFNAKRNTHDYYFEINNNIENLQINLNIYPNLKTNISINSTHRTFISYRGVVVE